jgi:BCD family chlorophyll transporter-like MFS transporter
LSSLRIFYTGIFFLGVGTGISTVSNLAIMLDMTIDGKVGLFIGAWGMASAISRLIGSVLGGAGRDLVARITGNNVLGYIIVFGVMAVFMVVTLIMLNRMDVLKFHKSPSSTSPIERASIAGDL